MNCPICNKNIDIDPRDEGMELFSCSEMVEFTDGRPLSHYEIDTSIGREIVVVHPYKIVTDYPSNKKKGTSRILKYKPPKNNKQYKPRYIRFQGLITVPVIHPDTPDKLLNRIKILLMLS